jgi:hypothetical protein
VTPRSFLYKSKSKRKPEGEKGEKEGKEVVPGGLE